MAKQELIEVGYYLGKTPRERIDYLIDNYSRMEEMNNIFILIHVYPF